jgi:nucleoside diphosphate kinase
VPLVCVKGYEVSAMRSFSLDLASAKEFLEVYKGASPPVPPRPGLAWPCPLVMMCLLGHLAMSGHECVSRLSPPRLSSASAWRASRQQHLMLGKLISPCACAGVVPEYTDMAEELTEGPVVALEVWAEDAVATFRQTAGPWDVEIAKELRPATIRAKFGIDRIRNGVHCSDLPEDGELECRYFFELLASSA